ncbi:MAG: DUF4352 domain-containing protein [Verrucomicrobia bacterium]|nr:DUF4352 domain-containing protein [Verrucomicrobiota bacterium]
MEAGDGTTGRSKRFIRIGEVSRFSELVSAGQPLPVDANGTGEDKLSAKQDPKEKRLAQIGVFRERGIISEESFRAQRRMQGDGSSPSIEASNPAPVVPGRKNRWRRIALGVVLLNIAGLGVAGFGVLQAFHRGDGAAATTVGTPAAMKVTPLQDPVYALGKAFRLGPYTYTVTGHQTTATLDEGRFSPVSANPGDEYFVVTFSVRNDSVKPRVFSIDGFKLQDANGALYAACSQGAAVPRTELTKGDLLLTEIQPAATKMLAAAFEVPAASLAPPLKLLLFERDLLGTHEATVYLP